MKYLIISLCFFAGSNAFAQDKTGNTYNIEALKQDWAKFKENLQAAANETDPQKKLAIYKAQTQELMERGQQLVAKVRDSGISSTSKQKLLEMISQDDEDSESAKDESPTFKETIKKINEEKDPKKKLAMIKAEAERLGAKGGEFISALKEKGQDFLDLFKKKS